MVFVIGRELTWRDLKLGSGARNPLCILFILFFIKACTRAQGGERIYVPQTNLCLVLNPGAVRARQTNPPLSQRLNCNCIIYIMQFELGHIVKIEP